MPLADQTIKIFDPEDEVVLRVEIVDANGNLRNPSGGVAGSYEKPREGTSTPLVFVNIALGIYEVAVIPAVDEWGDWSWYAKSSGDIVQSGDRTFHVRRRRVA